MANSRSSLSKNKPPKLGFELRILKKNCQSPALLFELSHLDYFLVGELDNGQWVIVVPGAAAGNHCPKLKLCWLTLKCFVKSQALGSSSAAATDLLGATGFRFEISPRRDLPGGVTALWRRSSSFSFPTPFSGLGWERLRWSAVKKLWTWF